MKRRGIALLLAAAMLAAGCTGRTTEESGPQAAAVSGQNPAERENKAVPEKTAGEEPSASGEIFAMDTYMTVACYGEQCEAALEAAIAEIRRLDDLLSVGNPESEISRLNASGSGRITGDTAAILEKALDIYRTTGGRFDITVYPLMEAWGFTTGNFQVPSEEEIASLLQNIGSDLLSYDPGSGNFSLGEAEGIDLGGIAKGYTSGKIMEIFEEYGLSAGVVSLGGNVHCFRTKPDGSLWRCGIQDPLDPEALMGVVELSDQAAVTSGAYERCFEDEETGKTYHHILDPESGYPAQSGVLSVTIISDNGMLADGLSTALYVGGLSEAVSYWQKYGDEFDFIIMTERGEVYVTENLQNCFTTDYPVMTVHQKNDQKKES